MNSLQQSAPKVKTQDQITGKVLSFNHRKGAFRNPKEAISKYLDKHPEDQEVIIRNSEHLLRRLYKRTVVGIP